MEVASSSGPQGRDPARHGDDPQCHAAGRRWWCVITNPGAVNLLAQKVNGAIINGGDGQHEHPTQALLDALTIRRRRGSLEGLEVAICGDIMHSRVARSNIHLLNIMGARVRVVGPPTLMLTDIERMVTSRSITT